MIVTELLIFSSAFILTYFGVRLFRSWSLKKGILDVPNERSSHTTPTPRGGGLILVIVALTFYGLISFQHPASFSWGYLAGAILISIVSWLDDIYSVSIVWRLLTHALAAVCLIIDKGYWGDLLLPDSKAAIGLGIGGAFVTFFWIVWLINAYNFMDGIDGIAGIQAAVAGLGWLGIGWWCDVPDVALFGGVILFSSVGFLLHNWHPARIFMGDVGSAFLGFTFAAMPLLARSSNTKPLALLPLAAIVFVWFFLFDSIVTFVRRAFRGERVWIAHREHLYQRLVSSGLSHGFVSALYGTTTLIIVLCVLVAFAVPDRLDITIIPSVIVVTAAFILFCVKRRVLT
jgi:Fuc2NAc and GlcNAc transferase